jgi:monoamine oxidase
MVEADCQTIDPVRTHNTEWDSMTFEAYLRSRGATEKSIATATVWTRAMLGQDPHDISALFFLTYCKSGGGLLQMRSDRLGGGQHLRIRQGTQLMANGLAGDLPEGVVRLSTPVTSITQGSGDSAVVEVTTADQMVFYARKVISTVPSPVLNTISFTPDLPPSKRLWAESTTYGYYTKAMMVFSTPFWVEKGYCGLTQSFTGPATVIRDTSSLPDQKYILTCFVASDLGRAWAALPTEEREKALVKQIGHLFEAEVEAPLYFINMTTYEWSSDPYSGWGCPCPSSTPGVMDTLGGGGLREPIGNLHFAGTETAVHWRGYMEGAVESGERAAAEVIRSLTRGALARL